MFYEYLTGNVVQFTEDKVAHVQIDDIRPL